MKQSLIQQLYSVTPIEGRYKSKVEELSKYLSEYALIKLRVEIEIKYLIFLSKIGVLRKFKKQEENLLLELTNDFKLRDALKIKRIEEETRHDIKAVEKYLRVKLFKTPLEDITEHIHIGLTSEDVNNIAYRIMLKSAINDVLFSQIDNIKNALRKISINNKNSMMLARTHGQPAVPTTFGKEIFVFYKRLSNEFELLKKQRLSGKLNGAVGNFNALFFVFPKTNWIKFSKQFISSFNLVPNTITTQINPFEDVICVLQNLQRINGILIDLNQDLWRYISDDYLKLAVIKREVGSSTMPQKINPIDFENSEGNLILANGLLQTMNDKLYLSRLQRDLSNSTVIRNLGTSLSYCLIGYKSLLMGLSKIDVNKIKMLEDLNGDWSILAEGLQTYLRNKSFHDAYYFVAKQTKGKKLDKNDWAKLINSLKIPETDKENLFKLTPQYYSGLASKLVSNK